MKKNILKTVLCMVILLNVAMLFGQSEKRKRKERDKQYKAKIKELNSENYKIVASANTIEVALINYYEKLNEKEGKYKQMVVVTENCPTENLCAMKAQNDALVQYATEASADVRGRINAEFKLDASPNANDKTSIDKFYSAYESMVKQSVAGAVKKSFAVSKKENGKYKYQSFFLVNEEEATNARLNAAKRALEESKINQEWGNKIHDFIQEGFEPKGNAN